MLLSTSIKYGVQRTLVMMYVSRKVLSSALWILSVYMVLTSANALISKYYDNLESGLYNFVNKDNTHGFSVPQIIPSPFTGIVSLNGKGNVGRRVEWVIWPNSTFTKIHGRGRRRRRTRSVNGIIRVGTHANNGRPGFHDVLKLEKGRVHLMWIAFIVSISIHLVFMFGKLIGHLNFAVFQYAIRTGLMKACRHRRRPLLARRRMPRKCVATCCNLKQTAPIGSDHYNFMKRETFIARDNHIDAENVEEASVREHMTMEESLITYNARNDYLSRDDQRQLLLPLSINFFNINPEISDTESSDED